ncbi:MAG: ABC transporter [Ignavibacteria bacterium RBG_16_34_14]|nr:MAG: ABC transporter [Ignavibacteria bacterium RBG_16_34_14]
MKNILHIIKKEFLQFKRDPKMFGIILVAPVLQLILLGYAATLDVIIVHTLVFDQDRSELSKDYIARFESSGFFSIDYNATNYNEVTEQINSGDIIVAVVIPNDFEKKIHRHETAKVQLLFNGSDGNTASIVAGYISNITAKFSQNLLQDYFNDNGRRAIHSAQITPVIRVWYNPLLKTRNFMVPGIVGLLLSNITLILASLAIVKEKEIGTLEQLIVTPIKPFELITGKMIPFIILGFAAVIIVITAMTFIFNIPVRGSVFFLLFASFLYVLSTLGFGLFVSTISQTQQQAMMISIFGIMVPMVYLSGFAFPIENMPEIIQYISYIIPLRYFVAIIRGVILKGTGFAELWIEALVLLIMGIGILFLSSLRFRKKIE